MATNELAQQGLVDLVNATKGVALNTGALVQAFNNLADSLNKSTPSTTSGGAIWQSVFSFMSSALSNSIVAGTATDSDATAVTAAINIALVTVSASGGGVVYFPPGTYPLTYQFNSNSLTQFTAIFLQNNVTLQGAGATATKFRLIDGANCHMISGRNLSYGSVFDIQLIGNRNNQALNAGGAGSAPTGIGLYGDIAFCHFARLWIHDTYDYNFGVEVGSCIKCVFEYLRLENAGSDCLDFKNTSTNSYGNIIHMIWCKTNGLQGETGEIFTCVDLAGQVNASYIRCEDVGTGLVTSGRTGIRFNLRDPAHFLQGATLSTLSHFFVTGNATLATNNTNTWGVDIMTSDCRVENGYCEKLSIGVVRRQTHCILNTIEIRDCYWGWNEDSTTLVSPPTIPTAGVASNIIITGCTNAGMRLDTGITYMDYNNIVLDGNDTDNLRIGTGCSNITFTGGSFINPVTANVADASAPNIKYVNVKGYPTSCNVTSATTVDLNSATTQSFSIAHGLAITPAINKISIALSANDTTTNWTATMFLRPPDSTNINVKVQVVTAGTAGSTANVVATVVP